MSEPAPPLETPARLLLVMAHPAMERSRANRAMTQAMQDAPGVTFVDLYEIYPDFVIDVRAEQKRLVAHDSIAIQFPLYWYSTPALLKEWFDLVWLHGFAYGRGGTALAGKKMIAACSTGANEAAYHPAGANRFTIEEFLRPIEQTAALCGMEWLPPFVLHAAAAKSETDLEREARAYRDRLMALVRGGPLQ
ncbi:MAG TPA: NAD(P)H-dependent oxidoreductase [Caulobacteraceae bacterium]|nr:NAD(P)H-dependent oxidoreductase [Caulobacteraceae bacterium]